MYWVGLILAGLALPTLLLFLWLHYGVTEYCVGCGKSWEDHDKGPCLRNTVLNKVGMAFVLTLMANAVFVVILLFLWLL